MNEGPEGSRSTENDILRELPLRYERTYLGRKKPTDPPVRGRADYVLVVTGASRWVLEVKAPSEEISQDTIEQAISYARHPEVGGVYAVILNGKRLFVFSGNASSDDLPLVDIEISSPQVLAERLEGVLSPSAIRRDFSPPRVDLGKPLAPGFRSTATVAGGFIKYEETIWQCDYHLPQPQRLEMDEVVRRLRNYRSTVTGGTVGRDSASRIRAKLTWTSPSDELLQLALDKRLMDAEYLSLEETVSTDPAAPTLFDVVGGLKFEEGEEIFDIVRWSTSTAQTSMSMSYRGQALGIMSGTLFSGVFTSETQMTPDISPAFQIRTYSRGSFEITLAAD